LKKNEKEIETLLEKQEQPEEKTEQKSEKLLSKETHPYSSDFTAILEKYSRGEKPPGIRDIDDSPLEGGDVPYGSFSKTMSKKKPFETTK